MEVINMDKIKHIVCNDNTHKSYKVFCAVRGIKLEDGVQELLQIAYS